MNHKITVLELNEKSFIVDPGSIQFPIFQEIKESAIQLADHVQKVEVTEENVKESKRLVAAVSKQVKVLNDERIAVKKQILEPYNKFEEQVKEITGIVKSSEEVVRQQIRQLEERERAEKEQTIETLFYKRMKQYDFESLFGFKDFFEQKFLNKTYSLTKVEKEMASWFEKISRGVEAISNLKHSDEVLNEYRDYQNLSLAIGVVSERHQKQAEAKKAMAAMEMAPFKVSYRITDEKDARLLEMYMQQNQIKYEKVGN